MDKQSQPGVNTRTPKLRGDISAGEVARQLVQLQRRHREQLTKQILRTVGRNVSYLTGAIIGAIALPSFVLNRLDIDGESGTPAAILLALALIALAGLSGGVLFAGVIRLGIVPTRKSREWDQGHDADRFDR